MKQIEIKHHAKEKACENCPCKLYAGDKMYQSDDKLHTCCSTFCARAGERANSPLVKSQPKDDVCVDGWLV